MEMIIYGIRIVPFIFTLRYFMQELNGVMMLLITDVHVEEFAMSIAVQQLTGAVIGVF